MTENELFPAKPGNVDWDLLRDDLMKLSKETLVELVNAWLKTYWSLQNYWMIFTEEVSGFDTTALLDHKVWQKVGPIQAYRVKKAMKLGDDIQSLATMFKHTAPQWSPAGFEWEISEITDNRLLMTVHDCPMGKYRRAANLELLPCKLAIPSIYEVMAKVINENIVTTCVHAHPDPPKEGIMCQWECVLEG